MATTNQQRLDDVNREIDRAHRFAKYRALVGIFITFVWILLAVYLAVTKHVSTLDLNELGDYVAGASAPLAFLWLVIGYWQQSMEIRLNASELRLQVHELSESVRHQAALAEIARDDLHSRRLPMLHLTSYGYHNRVQEGEVDYAISIKNEGPGAAYHLRIFDTPGLVAEHVTKGAFWPKDDAITFTLRLPAAAANTSVNIAYAVEGGSGYVLAVEAFFSKASNRLEFGMPRVAPRTVGEISGNQPAQSA